MTVSTETMLVLVGHGSRLARGAEELRAFIAALREAAPRQPITAAALEFNDPPVARALQACAQQGYRRAIVQPLLLFGATHHKNDIPAAIAWAAGRHPQIQFVYGRPLGPHPALLNVLDDRIAGCDDGAVPAEQTAILLIGRGTSDPDANSEAARMARLFWEGRRWGWVEVAYSGMTRPAVAEGVERCLRLGARRVIVAPLLLFHGVLTTRIAQQARDAGLRLGIDVAVAEPLGAHSALIQLTLARAAEAARGLAAMNCDSCKYRVALRGFAGEVGLPQHSDHHHGLRGVDAPLIGGVPRAPGDQSPGMPSAELIFRKDGLVDWGAMWHNFCELALTGGPPVRHTLLTASPNAATDAAQLAAARHEIARGISETSGLEVCDITQAGWIGFDCEDERMAVWMTAALIIENIAARFDGKRVYIPVDGSWRLKYEIKNVITAVAKTAHYWQEHRPRPIAELPPGP